MAIGRNELCPCGSGKKYKKCCAKKEQGIYVDTTPMRLVKRETSKKESSHYGIDEVRVFSYYNWELFHGHSPCYTDKERDKLKSADGTRVRFTRCDVLTGLSLYLFDRNPLGVVTEIDIFSTRSLTGKDYSADDWASIQFLTTSIEKLMRIETMSVPFEFTSLGLVDDLKTGRGGFALLSICEDQNKKRAMLFDLKSEIAQISTSDRDKILQECLPMFYRFIPNGLLAINNDIAVFILSPDRLMKCLKAINPNVEFILDDKDKKLIDKYFECYDGTVPIKTRTKNEYERICRKLMKAVSNPEIQKLTIDSGKETKALHQKMHEYLSERERRIKAEKRIKELEEAAKQKDQIIEQRRVEIETLKKDIEKMSALLSEYSSTIEGLMVKANSIAATSKQQIKEMLTKKFSQILTPKALEYLIDAEFLYQTLKDEDIDFGPIIVEYAKVLETQVRERASAIDSRIEGYKTTTAKMIELIVNFGSEENYRDSSIYYDITRHRNQGAHSGIKKSIQAVEEIRDAFYRKGILGSL